MHSHSRAAATAAASSASPRAASDFLLPPAPPAAAREWECMRDFAGGVDLSWRDDAISILEAFTERTPGSVLEPKDSCLTWHYADADPDFGLSQAKNLQLHIDQMLANQVRECSLSLLRTFPL